MRHAGITLGLALLSHATQSEAQQTSGRFRLGVDGTVLNAESGTVRADEDTGAIEADYGSTSAGLFASGVGVVLGGGGENLVGGARLSFATQSQKLEFEEASGGAIEQRQTTVSLLPQLAYVFAPGSRARFFMSASIGYQSSKSESEDETTATASGFLFGGGVGLLGFITPRMSIDPTLSLLRFSGNGDAAGLDTDYAGTIVMLTVGLSGWLGGSDPLPAKAPGLVAPDEPSPGAGAAGAAPTEAEAEPEPEFETRVTSQGSVTRGLRLESGTLIRLLGQPNKDGGRVIASVSVLEPVPVDLESWTECRQGAVNTDSKRYPMKLSTGEAGFGSTAVLRGLIRVGVILELLRSGQNASLELCGTSLALGKKERRAMLDFMRSFKTVAERYETWDPSLDSGASEVPASEEVPETPAPETPADPSQPLPPPDAEPPAIDPTAPATGTAPPASR